MPEAAVLKCPSCASPISSAALDSGRGLAQCGYCGSVLTLPAAVVEGRGKEPAVRTEIPQPRRVALRRSPDGVEMELHWFSWPVLLLLVPFGFFWGFVLVFFWSAVTGLHAPWFIKLMPVAHTAAGAFLVYFTAATLVNSTRIEVKSGRLLIRHGPIPWPGNREIEGSGLTRVFYRVRTKRDDDGNWTHHEVCATRTDGTEFKLLGAGIAPEQGRFIAQEVGRALGLGDQP